MPDFKFLILIFILIIILCILISPTDLITPKLKVQTFEKEIIRLRRQQPFCRANFYCRRPETQHIDCGKVLSGDKAYTSTISNHNRIPIIEDDKLDMSCPGIKSRVMRNQRKLKKLKFPIAFARIVYKDYEFLEKQVEVSWHPQNYFCFVLDKNSKKAFKKKIRSMGKCITNVLVIDEELRTDSFGHNMNLAHYKCMQELRKFQGWTYLMTLQNHDVIGKSIYEISRILELLGGANDIEIVKEYGRVEKQFKWDMRTLKLFRNESLQTPDFLSNTLQPFKGAVQATVSRKAVEFLVDTVDPTVFMDQWNHGWYGVDEQWLATFQANEFLGMPGHFTGKCVEENATYRTDFVSRWDTWKHDNDYSVYLDKRCGSKHIRHLICLLGIEDLPIVSKMPNLVFNKVLPSFDYSIIECTAELLYNRTFLGQEEKKLEEEYYANMVNVLYHKNHLTPGYQLNCTPTYQPWIERKRPIY